MGVEYRHFLTAAEPLWLPTADTLARIEVVLKRWKLITGEPEVFDLTGGYLRKVSTFPTNDPGPGIAVIYPEVVGPIVADLFGDSYYSGISAEERYLQSIKVIVGLDYRIQSSSESICFTVLDPPREAGVGIEPYGNYDLRLPLYAEAYACSSSTSPPKVKIEIDPRLRSTVDCHGYAGYWRGAVVLDCGKDIPAFLQSLQNLPSQDFVRELGEAMRTRIYEIGEIY